MDVAFEKQDWTIARDEAVAEVGREHPDWYVLRARMRAARQAWQVLRETRAASAGRQCGSFDRGSARQLAVLKWRVTGVNQKVSVNSNRGRDTYGAVADLSSTGGRG